MNNGLLESGLITEQEIGKQIGKAVSADIKGNPNLLQMIDQIILESPTPRKEIIDILREEALKAVRYEDKGIVLFPRLRSVMQSLVQGEGYVHQFGLGFLNFLGTALSGLFSAGTAVYSARLNADAQEKVAEIQASVQMAEIEAQRAESEAKKAQAEAQLKQLTTQMAALEKEQQANVPQEQAQAGMVPGLPADLPILPIALVGGGALLLFFVIIPALKGK